MGERVSIAMTTYNGERFLREQLDGFYKQTRLPDEVVVCDDCSTDGTVDILKEYHLRYGLKYYVNSEKLGVCRNFERAVSLCTGDYVALSDQDDVWFPEKIEKSLERLKRIEKNGLPSLVSSSQTKVDALLRPIHSVFNILNSDSHSYEDTLFGFSFQGCTLMMNRHMIDASFPLPSSFMFDCYLGVTASMIGNKSHIGESLMYYRHHDNNVIGRYQNALIRFGNISILYFVFHQKERLELMKYIEERHSDKFLKERVPLFHRIIEIAKEENVLKKMWGIMRIGELSAGGRLLACFNVVLRSFKN